MSLTNAVINEKRWRLKEPLITGHNAPVLYVNKYISSMIDDDYIDEVKLRWGDKNLNHMITSIICIALTVDLGIINAHCYRPHIEKLISPMLKD